MEINELCEESHKIAKEKGFWDSNRSISECLMLIVTEISEACESDRMGDLESFKVELADTFIRLGDLCGYLNIDIDSEIQYKMKINKERPYRHGKRY